MPSFKSIKFSLVLLFSISLAACGGGGNDPTKPSVDNFNKNISKNATSVGTLSINNGGKTVTAVTPAGADAASFDVSTAGVITVKSGVTLDPTTKSSYAFTVTATNEIGTSDAANVSISIVTTKPTITDLSASIPENSTTVGTLTVDNGGKNISAFTLSGNDSVNFTVSDAGIISVKTGTTLDSSVKNSYSFTVTATNEVGTSDAANVTVAVTLVEQNFTGTTPKIMFIGDSITSGQGGDFTEADAAAAVLAAEQALATATTNLRTATSTFNTKNGILTGAKDEFIAASNATSSNTVAITALNTALDATPVNYAAATTALTTAAATENPDVKLAALKAAITATKTASEDLAAKTTDKTTAETDLTTAENDAKFGIQHLSYRKYLNDLTNVAGSIVKYKPVGIINSPITSDGSAILFENAQHEGYSGWYAQQLTDKKATYVCTAANSSATGKGVGISCKTEAIGKVLTGGPINVCTAADVAVLEGDAFKYCYAVGDLYAGGKVDPATDLCTEAMVTAGTCTAQELGFIVSNIFDNKLSAIDYSLSANDGNNDPKIALIHLGTNDMAFRRINNANTKSEAIKGLQELINTLRAKNDRIVILLANIIPISTDSQYYLAGIVEEYNADISTLVGTMNQPKSPIVAVNQYGAFNAGDLSVLLSDGVHPSIKGEKLMAKTWEAALKPFFQ